MRFAVPLIFASATLAMTFADLAHSQSRLSTDCRREIVRLCGQDRSAIAACLREKVSELSAPCREDISKRVQARRGGIAVPVYPGPSHMVSKAEITISYGDDPRQIVHYYAAESSSLPPLVLFIHGGGWTFGNPLTTVHDKADHYTAKGYAFASAGYRMVPDATVEQQSRDVVAAIATLRAEAEELGFDPDRIVLMGHSAGAHLAALVATDERYSASVLDAIAGVVLLDGAAYDVAAQMASGDTNYPELYAQAFGNDPERQRVLSPLTHVGGRDASDWLMLHVARRDNAREQADLLSTALERAGRNAVAVPVRGTSHMDMNRNLGTDRDRSTELVDEFLARIFG